jgi:hypothetical protein
MTLEDKEFRKAMKKLLDGTKPKKMIKALNMELGTLVRNVVSFTPPTGNAPQSEGPAVQKKAGQLAIKYDILKRFKPLPKTIKGSKGWQGSIVKLIRNGRLDEASNLLNKIGYPHETIIQELTEQLLDKQYRDKRGRVRDGRTIFVAKKTSINKIIKIKQKKVGFAKSGWKQAVSKFKAKRIPKWAMALGGKGFARSKILGPTSWEIIFGNKVAYANKNFARRLRITQRALKASSKNILKKIDILLKKEAKKAVSQESSLSIAE